MVSDPNLSLFSVYTMLALQVSCTCSKYLALRMHGELECHTLVEGVHCYLLRCFSTIFARELTFGSSQEQGLFPLKTHWIQLIQFKVCTFGILPAITQHSRSLVPKGVALSMTLVEHHEVSGSNPNRDKTQLISSYLFYPWWIELLVLIAGARQQLSK